MSGIVSNALFTSRYTTSDLDLLSHLFMIDSMKQHLLNAGVIWHKPNWTGEIVFRRKSIDLVIDKIHKTLWNNSGE